MTSPWLFWAGGHGLAWNVLAVLGGTTLRGTIVILLAAGVVRLWPRASAAQRHLMWMIACCSQLLLPVLTLVAPAWRVPIRITSVAPLLGTFGAASRRPGALSTQMTHLSATLHSATLHAIPTVGGEARGSVGLALLIGAWGMGALIVLAILMNGRRRLRQAVGEAHPLVDPSLLGVLDRAMQVTPMSRRVDVKLHEATIPMVFGVLRPTIVLPVNARTWDEARLYNVLLHELEHVKRHDCLVQTVASLVCALYWFNPLIWLAVRALQMEQEQACDDAVLTAGNHPRDYATDLLELTQTLRPSFAVSLAVLPFARPSQLQTRVRAIVDRSKRRCFVSRRGVLAAWGAGMMVMYPLVGVTPQWMGPEVLAHQQSARTRARSSLKNHNPITEIHMLKRFVIGPLTAVVVGAAPLVAQTGQAAQPATREDLIGTWVHRNPKYQEENWWTLRADSTWTMEIKKKGVTTSSTKGRWTVSSDTIWTAQPPDPRRDPQPFQLVKDTLYLLSSPGSPYIRVSTKP